MPHIIKSIAPPRSGRLYENNAAKSGRKKKMLNNIILVLCGCGGGLIVGFVLGMNWERNSVTNDMRTLYAEIAREVREFKMDTSKAIEKFKNGG